MGIVEATDTSKLQAKMADFKIPISWLLLLSLLNLFSRSEGAPTYFAHYCSNSSFFTPNSTYQANLNLLLSDLSSNSTRRDGFYKTSVGQNLLDVATGLLFCRGDLTPAACKDCISTATKDIQNRCPFDKIILIWYDVCTLRYTNESDLNNLVPFENFNTTAQNVIEPDWFNALLAITMNSLKQLAANSQADKKFATAAVKFTSSATLYCLVQCTPELSVSLCLTVLESAIGSLPMCCTGKQGGTVVLPSSNIRYELYPFFNYTASSTQLPPLPRDMYESCSNMFNCGKLNNIGFPFWGENRPNSCGYPGLKLNCRGSVATIKIMKVAYQVLGVNPEAQILKITREDFSSGICYPEFVNSTLDPTLFDFGIGLQNLTLAYGCDIPEISLGQFSCEINGFVHIKGGAHGPGECNVSVVVPVPVQSGPWTGIEIDQSKLEEAIGEGFDVKWKVDTAACLNCTVYNGVCGYDLERNQSTCYFSSPGSSWWNQPSKGVVAGIVGTIAIVFVMIICYLKREQLSSMEMISKKKTKDNQYAKAFIMNQGSLAPKQYSYSDIKKMTHSFKNKLGQGGYGSVYKGKLLDDRLVAVKVINDLKGDGEDFINEVASISRTSHVNIVTLLGYCYERTKRALVYEFMPNGSLDKFICDPESSSTNYKLEHKTLLGIAVGIARGLEYLHRGCSTRILHFDIKPQNILLDDNFCPKISDFGLARLCQKKESIVSMLGTRGTIGYIAPEVFSRSFGGVSHKSDVYSYGMLILEMVGVNKNFDAEVSHTTERYFPNWIYQNLNLCENVENSMVIIEEEEQMKKKMILVGLWCIQTIPTNRPSMTKVVEMLEGNVHSIEIPPKPFLFSPARSVQYSSTTSLP